MSALKQAQEWKGKANAEYQKVIGAIIALATAALILPTLFLKDFIALPQGTALLPKLTMSVFVYWGCLSLAILSGVVFYYVSAKWLKQAYGGPVSVSEKALECWLDVSFWLTAALFIGGLLCFVWFIAMYAPKS